MLPTSGIWVLGAEEGPLVAGVFGLLVCWSLQSPVPEAASLVLWAAGLVLLDAFLVVLSAGILLLVAGLVL